MLKIVKEHSSKLKMINESPDSIRDHNFLLDSYLQSHRIRNHAYTTVQAEKRFLEGWFASHGSEWRPLYAWEAMRPIEGRKIIHIYGKVLIDSGLANATIRHYLGFLRNFFSYVLQHPYIHSNDGYIRIIDKYGVIEQPVSEFDMPQHSYGQEQQGLPFDPEHLYRFYQIVRDNYITNGAYRHTNARDYAMMVLAGESGLRANELIHLELSKDIFFDSKKIQTRFAKSANGSGKKARTTLFTPLARDTLKSYITHHRPYIKNSKYTDYLFITKNGQMMNYSSMHQSLLKAILIVNKKGMSVSGHMSWHWFRRLFATRFIEKFPGQISVLVSLMGHSSLSTVHRYIHHSQAWMNKRIQEVIEGVDYHGH